MSEDRDKVLDVSIGDIDTPYIEYINSIEKKAKKFIKDSKDLDKEYRRPRANMDRFFTKDVKHPISFVYAMRYQFGNSWIDWEPETIKDTFKNVFNIDLSKFDQNLIGSIKALLKKSKFYNDYRVFGWTCYAFNNQVPRMDTIPRPYPSMILDTYNIAPIIRNGMYSEEVKRYIETDLKDFGAKGVPELLEINLDDEGKSNLKAYLNVDKGETKNIVQYLSNNDKNYLLKSIGMIDYYLARLKTLDKQINLIWDSVI